MVTPTDPNITSNKSQVPMATDMNRRMGFNNFMREVQGAVPTMPYVAPEMPNVLPEVAPMVQSPFLPMNVPMQPPMQTAVLPPLGSLPSSRGMGSGLGSQPMGMATPMQPVMMQNGGTVNYKGTQITEEQKEFADALNKAKTLFGDTSTFRYGVGGQKKGDIVSFDDGRTLTKRGGNVTITNPEGEVVDTFKAGTLGEALGDFRQGLTQDLIESYGGVDDPTVSAVLDADERFAKKRRKELTDTAFGKTGGAGSFLGDLKLAGQDIFDLITTGDPLGTPRVPSGAISSATKPISRPLFPSDEITSTTTINPFSGPYQDEILRQITKTPDEIITTPFGENQLTFTDPSFFPPTGAMSPPPSGTAIFAGGSPFPTDAMSPFPSGTANFTEGSPFAQPNFGEGITYTEPFGYPSNFNQLADFVSIINERDPTKAPLSEEDQKKVEKLTEELTGVGPQDINFNTPGNVVISGGGIFPEGTIFEETLPTLNISDAISNIVPQAGASTVAVPSTLSGIGVSPPSPSVSAPSFPNISAAINFPSVSPSNILGGIGQFVRRLPGVNVLSTALSPTQMGDATLPDALFENFAATAGSVPGAISLAPTADVTAPFSPTDVGSAIGTSGQTDLTENVPLFFPAFQGLTTPFTNVDTITGLTPSPTVDDIGVAQPRPFVAPFPTVDDIGVAAPSTINVGNLSTSEVQDALDTFIAANPDLAKTGSLVGTSATDTTGLFADTAPSAPPPVPTPVPIPTPTPSPIPLPPEGVDPVSPPPEIAIPSEPLVPEQLDTLPPQQVGPLPSQIIIPDPEPATSPVDTSDTGQQVVETVGGSATQPVFEDPVFRRRVSGEVEGLRFTPIEGVSSTLNEAADDFLNSFV